MTRNRHQGHGSTSYKHRQQRMPSDIELSVIVSTFERPQHLERCLASLALQRRVEGQCEVIVADDGSRDRTHVVVDQFARTVDFPVKLTTHPHAEYCVARSRNDGVRASRASYLLFVDGDCIVPPDHLATHLRVRRSGVVWAGNGYRLTQEASEQIDLDTIASHGYRKLVPPTERQRLRREWLKNKYYQLVGHPTKPKLDACDFGVWRSDIESVNGFDESFKGWGCEDDDLGIRLRRAGLRIDTILRYTRVFHLWHEFDPSHPGLWRQGANVDRLLRFDVRPIRCRQGLVYDAADEAVGDFSEPPVFVEKFRVPHSTKSAVSKPCVTLPT